MKKDDDKFSKKCPCNTIDEEVSCSLEICTHIFPKIGWPKLNDSSGIDLLIELQRFHIAKSKNEARRLINNGAVRLFINGIWVKLEHGKRFFKNNKELFFSIGKKGKLIHILK